MKFQETEFHRALIITCTKLRLKMAGNVKFAIPNALEEEKIRGQR